MFQVSVGRYGLLLAQPLFSVLPGSPPPAPLIGSRVRVYERRRHSGSPRPCPASLGPAFPGPDTSPPMSFVLFLIFAGRNRGAGCPNTRPGRKVEPLASRRRAA